MQLIYPLPATINHLFSIANECGVGMFHVGSEWFSSTEPFLTNLMTN